MKTKYSNIKLWELLLVFSVWTFLDLRVIDYLHRFEGSYAVLSILISFSLLFWLKKSKNVRLDILPRGGAWSELFGYYFLCALTLIPLGLAIGFIEFSFSFNNLLVPPFVLVGIYFTIGLIEELVFRQILLVYFWKKINFNFALILSSFIFGVYHLNNLGFPNWDYVILASIAGIIYGLAFKKLGLAWAVLLHSLVDVSKLIFFRTI